MNVDTYLNASENKNFENDEIKFYIYMTNNDKDFTVTCALPDIFTQF